MPQARRTVDINRPVLEVFEFFTEPENDHRWRPHVREIARLGPPAAGATIHQVIDGPGGRPITADMVILAYQPGELYAFKVTTGPVRPIGEFQFFEYSTGTEVSFQLSARITGLRRLVMARPVQRSMDGEMKALDTAKRLLDLGQATRRAPETPP